MNAEERQALREKHTCFDCDFPNCHWCVRMDYPCDVIKLLDATESEVTECDHLKGGEIPEWEQNVWVWFTYCPKCGEKL